MLPVRLLPPLCHRGTCPLFLGRPERVRAFQMCLTSAEMKGIITSPSLPTAQEAPPQVQGFAFAFVELHEVPLCSLLQSIQVPVRGCTTTWAHQTFLPVLYCLQTSEGVLCPVIHQCSLGCSVLKMQLDPWVTLLVIGTKLGFVLLLTTP